MPEMHSGLDKLQVHHRKIDTKKQEKSVNTQFPTLADYSSKDDKWRLHKIESLKVADIYLSDVSFEKRGIRMKECANFLTLAWTLPDENGETKLKLHHSNSCHVPHCPVCQWRRSLLWFSKLSHAIQYANNEHPGGRWLFLTLTVRNCCADELGATMTAMNQAWRRLVLRKEFKSVLGWARTTEITRGDDNSAHPHFHALLFVRPSYFKGQNYIKQARWVELWQSCMRLDYAPNVDIRVVKPKRGSNNSQADAIAETAKYSVKVSDMTADKDWFLEMARQTTKKRMIALGGVIKEAFAGIDVETEKNLVNVGDGDGEKIDEDAPGLIFKFNSVALDYFLLSNKARIEK